MNNITTITHQLNCLNETYFVQSMRIFCTTVTILFQQIKISMGNFNANVCVN